MGFDLFPPHQSALGRVPLVSILLSKYLVPSFLALPYGRERVGHHSRLSFRFREFLCLTLNKVRKQLFNSVVLVYSKCTTT